MKNLENIKVQEQEDNLYGGISHWYFLVCCGDLDAVFILKGLPSSCTQATSKQYLEKRASFFSCPRGGRGDTVKAANTIYSQMSLRVSAIASSAVI